jgi:hypothetical protein
MLRVSRQGAGWTVSSDGVPVADDTTSGVHRTLYSAIRHICRASVERSEHVAPETWHRRHSNGALSIVRLNEDGELRWRVQGALGGGEMTPAHDAEDAERAADAAAHGRALDASPCGTDCGSWSWRDEERPGE